MSSEPNRIEKAPDAFRTISEVSETLDVPQHVLRFWEAKFSQVKPLKRAGGRRYYRPEDVALVRRIDQLLNRDGYTVRGVQQLLAAEKGAPPAVAPEIVAPAETPITALRAIRDMLAEALAAD